tara:strand:+ start:40358 stop:41347 length:990 start_codon:yes stop_codon:yes gene_type:complete
MIIDAVIDTPFGETVVEYPAFTLAFNKLTQFFNSRSNKPRGLLIVGPSGAGKSFLTEYFRHKHPVIDTDEATLRPVLYIETPPKTSLGDILSEMLVAMGDPIPESGTIPQRRRRLRQLLALQGTLMIFIDESQDLVPKSGADPKTQTIKLLKGLMNDTKIPLVLTGTLDAKDLITADAQIRTRIKSIVELDYFRCWTPDSALDFADYWQNLLDTFPRNVRDFRFCHEDDDGNISLDEDIINLIRMNLATNGCQRRIYDLLEEVKFQTTDKDVITKAIFAQAWETFSGLEGPGSNPEVQLDTLTFNPFEASPKKVIEEAQFRGLYDANNF